MRIDLICSPIEISDQRVAGCAVAVIDVFRATTVIATALANGAQRIIPMTGIDECFELRERLTAQNPDHKILLGGERNTVLIEGFDLDNSPLAYTREQVEEATLILSTTNGTRVLNMVHSAGELYTAAMVNARAVCRSLEAAGRDIVLICSGRQDQFTTEDALCAGLMIDCLKDYQLTDMAWLLRDLYRRYRHDLREPLSNGCTHYNLIKERLSKDVAYSLHEDTLNVVPKIYRDENSSYQEIRLWR